MSRPRAAFRQIEVTRLIRGVEAAGHKVQRIAFDENGKPVAILSEAELEDRAQSPDDFEERLRRSQGWQA